MKYFFASANENATFLIVAKTIDRAEQIMLNSGNDVRDLYEIQEDTYEEEGFLFESK